MTIDTYNIRVYGLCIENGKILIIDEVHTGHKMTKFPGGGLEMGESIEDGLKREFMEEMGVEISVGEVFYVNPFLQVSAFRKNEQLISLYYWVKLTSTPTARFSDKVQDFLLDSQHEMVFRWVNLQDLQQEKMTFPIDEVVTKKLIDSHKPQKITGIGGVFFQAQDPEKLKEWYKTHLGFETDQYGAMFAWHENTAQKEKALTQWSVFCDTSTYFAPSEKAFMLNYRVANLESLLASLKQADIHSIGEMQSYEYGKFASIMDPEGNKIELWEPIDEGF